MRHVELAPAFPMQIRLAIEGWCSSGWVDLKQQNTLCTVCLPCPHLQCLIASQLRRLQIQ